MNEDQIKGNWNQGKGKIRLNGIQEAEQQLKNFEKDL